MNQNPILTDSEIKDKTDNMSDYIRMTVLGVELRIYLNADNSIEEIEADDFEDIKDLLKEEVLKEIHNEINNAKLKIK